MILEMASISIKPGERAAFEAAYQQASAVIAQASGYISHQLQRSIEVENHYMLLVQWRTLADHMTGFRESPLFGQWRALIGPFFAALPQLEHGELVS
jgi:heme-degrading monooxygenase HmoA